MDCEDYRISLMALLDGEISDSEREAIENHLGSCYHCHEEYEYYRHIHELTMQAIPAAPTDFAWDTYYSGVCQKMQARTGWLAWSVVCVLLVISGYLMLFDFTDNFLSVLAGTIALFTSGTIAVLGLLCNCISR